MMIEDASYELYRLLLAIYSTWPRMLSVEYEPEHV